MPFYTPTPYRGMLVMDGYDFTLTGIAEIDQQHQRLIDAFARLEIFSKSSHGFAAAIDTLTFLRGYVKEHFAYEEQMLAEFKLPNLASHKETHNAIVIELESLWAALENGDEIGERVIPLMRRWIVDHINIEDAEYAKLLGAEVGASG